jgi:hypothetical protein
MIFISHSKPDKPFVSPIANKLAEVFGKDNVFYDEWSIQPGDGIINKMNEGLAKCKYFFLFVSKKSLQSKIFEFEWQTALYKATKSEIKVIPVKLDDCLMPDILLQTLYIDFNNIGFDNALRQIVEVASGKSSNQAIVQSYENVRGYISKRNEKVIVEFRAETYTEPHSKYFILVLNSQNDLEVTALDESIFGSGFTENLTQLTDGTNVNGILVDRDTATSPGFPFTIEVTKKNDNEINIVGLMRAISKSQYKLIPMIKEDNK